MISHNHKCIFIHISKCAGSSIEMALGVDVADISEKNNKNLFGWNEKHKLFLQHATPQELLDYGLIERKIWDSYYKFIIVRNPWERAVSDFKWMKLKKGIKDSFLNFLLRNGKFKKVLNVKNSSYRGDHLTKQIDYFFVNGEKIYYDKVLRFENLQNSLPELCTELNLSKDFFKKKINVNSRGYKHYSIYYSKKLKNIFLRIYKKDITFLNYTFEDKKNIFQKIKLFICE